MKLTEVEVLPLLEQPRTGRRYPRLGIRGGARRPARADAARSGARAQLIVLDEPEQIRSRSRAPVEAPGSMKDEHPEPRARRRELFRIGRSSRSRLAARRCRIACASCDLNPETPHIAHAPRHGLPRQHAGRRRRNQEHGGAGLSRGVLRALERRTRAPGRHPARILGSVPTGLAPNEAASPYLAERAYLAGPVASTYLIKGLVRRGAIFPDSSIAFIGSEDLVRSVRSDRAARHHQEPAQRLRRRPRRSQARRLRGAHHARRRQVSGPSRNRARRAKGRLHVARIRRRFQALRAAHAHGPGREIPRRRRIRAASRPARRRYLDPAQDHESKPKCATWRTSC